MEIITTFGYSLEHLDLPRYSISYKDTFKVRFSNTQKFKPDKAWKIPYGLVLKTRKFQDNCVGNTMLDEQTMAVICGKVVRKVEAKVIFKLYV